MSGLTILLRIAAIIFVVEGMIMLALSRFAQLSPQVTTAIDVLMLVLISSPFIFVLVIKPYVAARTQEINNAREIAERANRTKDEFLAHMSHELRTPLNAVIGFAQLLQYNPGEPLSPAQIDYTNSIIYSGKHLLEIINGMLDLAAIEADRVHISMEDIDARVLFEECISLMRPAAEARKIKLSNLASNGLNPQLHTDVVRLKQALINLLSNAIKYNVVGGAVTLDAKLMGDGYFRISVIDTGKGIAREYYNNIFEPFDRLGVESTRSIEGTGIGLTVTKKLVEKMKGRIGFESQEGAGSTFWVEIPLAMEQKQLLWNEDLSVGVEAIDSDHKILIELLNKVSDPVLSHTEVSEVLTELLNYTVGHFKREEAVMAACGYPNLAEHMKIHHLLAAKATLLAEEWSESEKPEVVEQLLDFLRAWLVKHIMEEDKAIGRYIRGHEREVDGALQNIEKTA